MSKLVKQTKVLELAVEDYKSKKLTKEQLEDIEHASFLLYINFVGGNKEERDAADSLNKAIISSRKQGFKREGVFRSNSIWTGSENADEGIIWYEAVDEDGFNYETMETPERDIIDLTVDEDKFKQFLILSGLNV